jgi:hypothetical protein
MIRSRNSSSGSGSSALGVLRNTALPLLLGLICSTGARGQGFGPDPFQPYNSQFAPFVYPMAPGPLDFGTNNGLNLGVRGANQFGNYLNSLRGTGPGARAGGGGGAGTPYYQANRAYDREFGRVYEPNKAADQRFESNQEMVTELYFKYLREKDPRKRAEIFRDYSRARNRADRELGSSRATPGAQQGARSTRREGRTTNPTDARRASDRNLLTTPPPLSSDTTRSRSARSGADSRLGPPPSPLGGSGSSAGPARGASPSQVLDRASRPDRPRIGPRPRGPGLDPSAAPPPP